MKYTSVFLFDETLTEKLHLYTRKLNMWKEAKGLLTISALNVHRVQLNWLIQIDKLYFQPSTNRQFQIKEMVFIDN